MNQNNQFDSGLDPLEVDVPIVVAARNDPNTQIVDCREQDEWDAARIDGTIFMPLDTLEVRMDELDRNRPVIVVCRSGRRSLIAAHQLTAAGFTNAKSMHGGLIAWADQGNELVS
jgi:rhodanese-related sulfurtransferase